MTPERLREIVADATSRAERMRATHEDFVEKITHDWKADAKGEFEEYIATVHGKRAPKSELDRIRREIEAEHRDRWTPETERALTLRGYAEQQELPTLEAYRHECEQPPSAAERYDQAVSDRGGPDRPLMLALLEQVTRRDIRRELSAMPPTAALQFYRHSIEGNGVSPDAVVRRAVLVQEIERRSSWAYDPKSETGAAEHAALLELTRLVAATKAARVPEPLQKALAEASEARRFAERMQQIHKLQPRALDEVLGPADPARQQKAEKLVRRLRGRALDGGEGEGA
jgi:hypothetical protein